MLDCWRGSVLTRSQSGIILVSSTPGLSSTTPSSSSTSVAPTGIYSYTVVLIMSYCTYPACFSLHFLHPYTISF